MAKDPEVRYVNTSVSDNNKIIVRWEEFYNERRPDMDSYEYKEMVYDTKEEALVKISELYSDMIDFNLNGN